MGMRAGNPMSPILNWGEGQPRNPNAIPNLRYCRRRASHQLSAKRPGGGSRDPSGGDRTPCFCIVHCGYRSAFDLVGDLQYFIMSHEVYDKY